MAHIVSSSTGCSMEQYVVTYRLTLEEGILLAEFYRGDKAECERMALDCDPCSPQSCVVAQRLKRRLDQTVG